MTDNTIKNAKHISRAEFDEALTEMREHIMSIDEQIDKLKRAFPHINFENMD